MTIRSLITASLLDYDATTITALDAAFGITFMDEGDGVGTGSCSLPLSDANADELLAGRYIRIFDNGTAVFTFKIEGNPEYRQIDQGEEVAQWLVASGRGWGCITDEVVIYPGFDLTLPLDSQWRLFSFASSDFPNEAGWVAASEQYEYLDGVAQGWRFESITDSADVTNYYPSPVGFPWPNSPKNGNGVAPTAVYQPTYWIWPSSVADDAEGLAFFRDTFTLTAKQPVTFSVTADNLFTLFLEGVPILGEDADTWMWQGYKEVTIVLPAGTFQVAAVVRNVDANLAFNPGGFLYAAYVQADDTDGDGSLVPWVAAHLSNADWVTTFSTTEWPGWTPGQILGRIMQEALDRGGYLNVAPLPSYSATLDTAGNSWDSLDTETSSAYLPSFAIEVGKTHLDALNQLHEEGWIRWHFRPDNPWLDVWAGSAGAGSSSAVFAAGVNILGLTRGQTAPYANALLVQYADGFVGVSSASAIAAYGSRVEDVLQTDAETAADARRLGRIELTRRITGARAAVVLTIEPDTTATQPYVGFNIFDNVTIPNEAGTGTEVKQVLSISCAQGDDGYGTYTLELGHRFQNPDREASTLLRAIGGKTSGSAGDRGAVS